MGEYRGQLGNIEIKTIAKGQNEGKKFRRIAVGKAHFSVFDTKLFPLLEEMDGKQVAVQYSERDNPDGGKPYWDFESIVEAKSEPGSTNGGKGNGQRDADTNTSIEAQVGVYAAAQIIAARLAAGIASTDDQACDLARGLIAVMKEAHGAVATPQEPAATKPDTKPTPTEAGKPTKDNLDLFWKTMLTEGIDKGKLAQILSQVEGAPVKDLQAYLKVRSLDDAYKAVKQWQDAQEGPGELPAQGEQSEFQDNVPF